MGKESFALISRRRDSRQHVQPSVWHIASRSTSLPSFQTKWDLTLRVGFVIIKSDSVVWRLLEVAERVHASGSFDDEVIVNDMLTHLGLRQIREDSTGNITFAETIFPLNSPIHVAFHPESFIVRSCGGATDFQSVNVAHCQRPTDELLGSFVKYSQS